METPSGNIFQIWRELGKPKTFVVRRDNWKGKYRLMVTDVKPCGYYGKATGYALPPLDGSEMHGYWGTEDKPKEINCAGCYQWHAAIGNYEDWNIWDD